MGILSFFKKKNKIKTEGLVPESKWIAVINESIMSSIDYDGKETRVDLSDIQKIIIETNDSGPWGTDVWWKIKTNETALLIPQGATGEPELLKYFQCLPNFDNEEFINSMRSTDNATFLVWEKQKCKSHTV